MSKLIQEIEKEQMKEVRPEFAVGDNVRVHVKIIEKTTEKTTESYKERIQVFEGTVISRKHEAARETFTVRKLSHGIGVERTFLVNSPRIVKVEVTRRGKVRRAKLFYLRQKVGKAARIKEVR